MDRRLSGGARRSVPNISSFFSTNANINNQFIHRLHSKISLHCRADSTKALWQNYSKIRQALETMSTDDTEKRDTQSEAAALCVHLDTLEMAFMAKFWDTILSKFQATSIILQKTDIDLATAVRALESLRDVVSARGLFNNFELQALNVL